MFTQDIVHQKERAHMELRYQTNELKEELEKTTGRVI